MATSTRRWPCTRNTRVAEALYGPLQSLEVCLRNRLHGAMTSAFGERWFSDVAVPLDGGGRNAVQKVMDLPQQRRESVGAIVAELSFGFWVGLLGPGYDATLWRRCLYRAFPNARRMKRRDIHGRFNMLRRLRNRVAHHEPVLRKRADRGPRADHRGHRLDVPPHGRVDSSPQPGGGGACCAIEKGGPRGPPLSFQPLSRLPRV